MLPIPKGVASPLALGEFQGAPLGMSRGAPQHEIQDTEAWTIVDANLNDPGLIRRRGPLTETATSSRATSRAIGITRAQDPAGAEQFLVLSAKTGSSASEVYGFGNTTITNMAWPYNCNVSPYELFMSNDALNGGVFIGTAHGYDKPSAQAIQLWLGASKDDASALALASPVTRGDKTISLSSAGASCCAGQFVFKSSQLVGVVKSVSSNTLTLTAPALISATSTIDVQALRGINPRVSQGRITTDATSQQVNGGATKFSAQGLGTGTWDLYTPDLTYIGTVASVTADIQLQLAATAAVSLLNSPYLAIRRDGSYSATSGTVGWMNATFAGHQFFASGNTVWFSDITDPEALDLTEDGNSFSVSADPIRAIVAGTSYLVIITETEAYALVGAVGTTPDKWRPERISDDGTICGMSAVTFQGGCIWAGKRGVWFYNGSLINMVDKLDGDYRLLVSTFTSGSSRAYGAIAKNHYLLFIEGGKAGIFQRVVGAAATDITRPTIAVHLESGATGLWENVELRGYIQPPDSAGRGTCLMPVTTTESATHKVRVIDGEQLFIDSGQDAYICEGAAQQGPKFFVETKKYDMGHGQRLKTWRYLLLHYWAAGGNLLFDTVLGLNSAGVTNTAQFLVTTDYEDQRQALGGIASQYLGFRFSESTISGDPNGSHTTASITRITLGAWAVAFKWKRAGRV